MAEGTAWSGRRHQGSSAHNLFPLPTAVLLLTDDLLFSVATVAVVVAVLGRIVTVEGRHELVGGLAGSTGRAGLRIQRRRKNV